MAGKIPRDFIQDVLARVDLVDLIDARVPLKPSGSNFVARCPFHTEKNPSFNVSRSKQFFHCYGCGANGNAIGFLMDYERLSFIEAVEMLAESVGLKIPTERARQPDDPQAQFLKRVFEVQERAARFYQSQLKSHVGAARAVAYLKARGVSGELAQRYRVGYAPQGWQNLPAELPRDLLEAAGLWIAKDGRGYDRFRDRIMFPIRDRRGRVVGFGGRVLGDETPKYLNSPETATFKKHKEVYGLYELLQAAPKPERIVVVEGYMDVIALAQHGIATAVATLGTATSGEHVELLFRFTGELVFCFDGDTAGQNAAWKALEAGLPALRDGKSVKFLALPEKHDPDSLVRAEGAEAFLTRIAGAQPFSQYFFEQLRKRLGLAALVTPEQRSALWAQAKPLVEKIPAGPFRIMVERRLSELTHLDPVERLSKSTKLPSEGAVASRDAQLPLMRTVLILLLQNPELAATVTPETRNYLTEHKQAGPLIGKVFALLDENPHLTVGGILECFRETPEERWVAKLAAWKTDIVPDRVPMVFADALFRLEQQLKDDRLSHRLQALLGKSITQLSAEEREELRRLTSK